MWERRELYCIVLYIYIARLDVRTIQKTFQCEKPRETREDKWFEVIRVFGWKKTGVVALEETRTQKEYNRREYGSEYTVGFKDKSIENR